jgi:tetratricopeptide (TPR) repeat protein
MPGHEAGAKPYPNNIKYLIKLYGYKVVEIADELQIPRSTLYDYISGNRPAPRECLRDIASFLGCDIGEFQYMRVGSPFTGLSRETAPRLADEKRPHDEAGRESIRSAEPDEERNGPAQGSIEDVVQFPASFTPVNLEPPPTDYVVWFGMKLAHIFTAITHGEGQARTCAALQARLNKEIMMFDDMKPQTISEEYTLSRRQAIIAIAALPVALLTAVERGHWSLLVKDEFLSRCAASITACWHLMAGREFTEVERALSNYLPLLATWAKQPSLQQKVSADLAAQGDLLMSLVALHTLPSPKNLQVRVAYCKQAVGYAEVSENRTLHITALTHLGNTMGEAGQPAEMLQKLLEAGQFLSEMSPLLRSKFNVELARAYARNGRPQEALRCIGDARSMLPEENVFVPIFLLGDSGLFHLIMKEGQTHLGMGDHHSNGNYYEQAGELFAQIETLPSAVVIPERFRIEIINQQALAAMKMRNLEQFCNYLEKGIHGAKALGSEKRRQEAIDIYWEARNIWPHEARVKELSDLFISMN